MFEDIKEAINKWKTENDKTKTDKRAYNDLEQTTQKTKD